MDLDSRTRQLEAAGLTVVDSSWAGPAPSPMAAWKLLIGARVVPRVTVRIAENGEHLREVESEWEALASDAGILGNPDGFLISVAGVGAATAPWALVKGASPLQLARELAPTHGSPEFVTMDLGGRNVCGVTSEEYDIWIVRGPIG